jgi:indole-3-glycerol phosphate synthase
MSTILSEILEYKKHEVDSAKERRPVGQLIDQIKAIPKPRPFVRALSNASRGMGLIAEVKKASPSAGVIRPDFDFLQIAREYESAGANCLSVLTDEHFFQGHLSFLSQIKQVCSLPLLRKDFTIESYQVYEARAAGADAVLLIVAALDRSLLFDLYDLSRSLEMDVLVEVHTEAEMEMASMLPANLIGINSRNLKTFVTDLGVVERLAALAPSESFLVAESGIKTAVDVSQVKDAGVNAILVGESLMRASNISTAIADLFSG